MSSALLTTHRGHVSKHKVLFIFAFLDPNTCLHVRNSKNLHCFQELRADERKREIMSTKSMEQESFNQMDSLFINRAFLVIFDHLKHFKLKLLPVDIITIPPIKPQLS